MPEAVRLSLDTPDHTTAARKAPNGPDSGFVIRADTCAMAQCNMPRGWVSPNARFHRLLEQFMLEVPGRNTVAI